MVKADGGDGRGRHDTEIVWNFRGRGLLEIGGHNMIDSFSGCWEAIQEEHQAEFQYMTPSYSGRFHLLLSKDAVPNATVSMISKPCICR